MCSWLKPFLRRNSDTDCTHAFIHFIQTKIKLCTHSAASFRLIQSDKKCKCVEKNSTTTDIHSVAISIKRFFCLFVSMLSVRRVQIRVCVCRCWTICYTILVWIQRIRTPKYGTATKNGISFPLTHGCPVRAVPFRLGTHKFQGRRFISSLAVGYAFQSIWWRNLQKGWNWIKKNIITMTKYEFVAQFIRFIVVFSQFNIAFFWFQRRIYL